MKLGEKFKEENIEFDYIFSSPQERVIQTAKISTNRNNQNLWFAKIRIESNKEDIQLKTRWGGSWKDADLHL